MRSKLLGSALLGALMVIVGGCMVPPPDPEHPYACRDGAVDLGPGGRIDVSADGGLVVVTSYDDESGGSTIDIVDRGRGTRRNVITTDPAGDGALLHVAADGSKLLGRRWDPGRTPWFEHDVPSGRTRDVSLPFADSDEILAFSGALDAAIVRSTDGGFPEAIRVDLGTGDRTALALAVDAGVRTPALSPDLSLAVQHPAGAAGPSSVRVVDTLTGSTVRDIGALRAEATWVDARFIDDRTVLIDDAVPASAPLDPVADDGAFLVDVPTGAVTRLDPGVPGAHTWVAAPSGDRSIFSAADNPAGPSGTWLRSGGTNRRVVDEWSNRTDAAITVLGTIEDGRARLICL